MTSVVPADVPPRMKEIMRAILDGKEIHRHHNNDPTRTWVISHTEALASFGLNTWHNVIVAPPDAERSDCKATPCAVPAGYVQVSALIEAREEVESWAAYATPYFQDKHDLAGVLARIDGQIAAATQSPPAAAVQNREPRTGIASQCYDSAQLSTLPAWCRDLLAKAADALSEAPPAALAVPEPAFRLTWRDGQYRVSKPNIGDTDCYTTEQVRAMLAAAERKGES